MTRLSPIPLTSRDFAPFGSVLETSGRGSFPINDGMTDRFHALAETQIDDEGTAILSIFRSRRWADPITCSMLERHPDGSQAFMPLSKDDWLIVVGAEPAARSLICFRARGDQGVQYARGIWHHPLLVLAAEQDFLVIDRSGPGDNLETAELSPAAVIDL